MWDSFTASFELLLRFDTFALMAVGVFLGIFVGALPGLTTTMAMAVLLPIAFFLDPILGIPFLLGVTKGGIFGGSVPAILVSIPGTGASVATMLDGVPMARQGKGRKALEVALVSSVFGDGVSDIVTVALIGAIALLAMQIGPPELAAVLILSLIVIAATASGSFVKGVVMLFAGLFIGMIGQDPVSALSRFTFDLFPLRSGVPLLPLLIGVFALPEIMIAAERRLAAKFQHAPSLRAGEGMTWTDFKHIFPTVVRSTGIGTALGAIPGMGQVVAAFLGYAAAKNASMNPEKFGKGEMQGVAGAEAANNAVNGPTLVPLLTLGIPGDNITAILLGAFIAQGLRPGPDLMVEQGPLIYAILLAMVACNLILLVLGYITIPLFARVVTVRQSLLLPATIVLAFVGTYAYRSDATDLLFLIFFGVFGYIVRKLAFDVTPMVMAFILGTALERSISQTLSLARGDLLSFLVFERPIAVGLLMATPFLAWWMWVRATRLRNRLAAATDAGG